MPNHTRTPRPKDAELAGNLAGTLARRCTHLSLPILTQHESDTRGPVTISRQRLVDAAGNLDVNLGAGVVLNIPSGHSVFPILDQSFLEAPQSLTPDSRSYHLGIWDHQASPDSPDKIVRFMDAVRKPADSNFAVLIGLADSPQTSPTIEFLDRHFGGRIPLFRLHGETLVLHSPDSRYLTVGTRAVAGLLAIAACFQPFQDLVEAVRSVEPNEAESLRQIFEEIFTPDPS